MKKEEDTSCFPLPEEIAEIMSSTFSEKPAGSRYHSKLLPNGQTIEYHDDVDDLFNIGAIDVRNTIDIINKMLRCEDVREDQGSSHRSKSTSNDQSKEFKETFDKLISIGALEVRNAIDLLNKTLMSDDIREDIPDDQTERTESTSSSASSAVKLAHLPQERSKPKEIVIGESDRNILDNPTVLYVLLQNKNWVEALRHLESNLDEAGIWIYRKDEEGKLAWRLLPLHTSIILEAPEDVIKAVLAAYPLGAQSQDDKGMLPLHLAFHSGMKEEAITLLLEVYPKSVEVRDFKGRLPLDLAQASSAPNRKAFLRALERGPSYFSNAELATARAATIVSITEGRRDTISRQMNQIKECHARDIKILQAEEAEKASKEFEKFRSEISKKQQELTEKISSLVNSNRVYQDEIEKIRSKTEETHQKELNNMLLDAKKQQQSLKDKITRLEADLKSVRAEAASNTEEQIQSIRKQVAKDKSQFKAAMTETLNKAKATASREKRVQAELMVARITTLETRIEELEDAHKQEIATLKAQACANEQELRDVVVTTKIEAKKKVDKAYAENSQLKAQLSRLVASERNSTKALDETMDMLEMQELEWTKTNTELTRKVKIAESSLAEAKESNVLLSSKLEEKTVELTQAALQFEERQEELHKKNAELTSTLYNSQKDLEAAQAEKELLVKQARKLGNETSAYKKRLEEEKSLTKSLITELSRKDDLEKEVELLRSKVDHLTSELEKAKSELRQKAQEEKRIQSKLEGLVGTEDNLYEQIMVLVSKLDQVVTERKSIETSMTHQIESLQGERDALRANIEMLTRNSDEQLFCLPTGNKLDTIPESAISSSSSSDDSESLPDSCSSKDDSESMPDSRSSEENSESISSNVDDGDALTD
eukprot:scaffold3359_cov123-Cylindrotheca_fusiformis.AAC.31